MKISSNLKGRADLLRVFQAPMSVVYNSDLNSNIHVMCFVALSVLSSPRDFDFDCVYVCVETVYCKAKLHYVLWL